MFVPSRFWNHSVVMLAYGTSQICCCESWVSQLPHCETACTVIASVLTGLWLCIYM